TSREPPWLVPIKFHDGVIGVVQADVKGLRRNNTALQKLRLISELIAPSVQDYRSLAAMEQMGFRFTRLQMDHRNENLFDATQRMTVIMHDILSPLASALIIEIGFNSIHHFHAEKDADKQLLQAQQNDSWLDHEASRLISKNQSIRMDINQTVVRSRQHQGRKPLQIGGLVFTIPNEKDDFDLPTLAAYYLNRKAVASIVADGIFDVARGFFSEIIKNMALEFSTVPLSDQAWFETVQAAVGRSGIRWAVAQPFKNGTYGEGSDRIKLHSNLSDSDRAALLSQRLVTPDAESFPTPRVVEISLRRSNRRLWLGIERENFGAELDFESPWRIFLENLADVADAALDSMQKKREAELAREDQEVIAIAVMTGTLTHQIFNLLGDQVQATEVMGDEVSHDPSIKLTNTYQKQFRNLRTSALIGRDLTEAFSRITKGDTSRVCNISEAAEEAYKLHRMLLKRREIEVRIDPSTEQVKVPFFRAAFALANLVGNASDAIRYKGNIHIEAEETDEFIICHVTNDGLAIRENMRERLFEFGATDKPDHKGWGLYYVRRLLAQIGGKVELAYSFDNNTRFTIGFPKTSAQE
ncbi:MAG TPA: HAMP domain-containing sensor histidine kinase, partial [Pyrinomonadaceae bacterium]|nr:HAMP domain-containing sensor histidine kinase [Pyrinomonadaceae bacterium]